MKKRLTALTIVCALAAGGWTFNAAQTSSLRYVPNQAFGFGERLNFDVSYGFITAGEAAMFIDTAEADINGHKCYHVEFEVASKPSFDWLYKVRDHYETYLDIDGIFPWRFEQHIREGGYTRDFSADFDQVKHIASTTEGKSVQAPEFVQDILSAYYFVRTMDLKSLHKDDVVHLQNFYKDTVHSLDVQVLGRQQVEVDAGTFNCVVIEPLVTEGGLFKSSGRIIIWLTDDDRKIPVKVSTKVVIGSIDAVLTSYSGIRGPIDAKVE